MNAIIIMIALCGLSAEVFGAVYQADSERGLALATAQCESCHGNAVIAMAKQFPNLKGQKFAYLNKQLVDFKAGLRLDPLMQAQVSALSSEQLQDVALFYSQQVTPNLSAD
ncbi:c-type cytochrome [Shewanella baltica]|jgi:cytochrome c553|uniref:c-type cytochrome n=1 Tax=Shewanella baltica TaxID=62322 RepID=UPI00217D90A0|nr:c-type cytochrome [Shewanella baltica]MCS6124961.1 cytochrome C [Shewanella baltica]